MAEMTHEEFEERKLAFLEKTRDNVEQLGWSFIGVGRSAHDDPGPAFGYTVGMWKTWQQPEVLVVGLLIEMMHYLASEVADAAKDGRQLLAGHAAKGWLEGGYMLRFREIAPPHLPLNVARQFYGGDGFQAVQAVYPDTQHRFPWDEGYDLDPRIQPLVTGDGSDGLG